MSGFVFQVGLHTCVKIVRQNVLGLIIRPHNCFVHVPQAYINFKDVQSMTYMYNANFIDYKSYLCHIIFWIEEVNYCKGKDNS